MKLGTWLMGFLLVLGVVGCAEEKTAAPYGDLKAVYQGVTDAQEQLAVGLQVATEATKVASVLKAYTAKMRDLAPRLNEAQARYPEMAKADKPPVELAATVEALNVSTANMMDSLTKVQQFLEDPAVTEAMNDLAAAARAAQ